MGYREIFSRYSENYTSPVPIGQHDKICFYRKLIEDVLSVNMTDSSAMGAIVTKCLVKDEQGNIGGLRRAESLLLLVENGS